MQSGASQNASRTARAHGVMPSPPPIRSLSGPGRPRARAISVRRCSQKGSLTRTLNPYSPRRR